jgi:shikimate kinase
MINKPIAFVGFMCCGKTTIGREIAKSKQLDFFDTDTIIIDYHKMSITEIFAKFGENYFIDCEREVIANLINKKCIISTGGAAFTRQQTFTLLKKHTITVYLKVSSQELYNRLKQSNLINRPNIVPIFNDNNPIDKIESMLKKREKWYKKANIIQNNN